MKGAGEVLVIGGGGFVGQHLLRRLQGPVSVISPRKLPFLPLEGRSHVCGLDDTETLAKLLPNCRWIVHLASETTPGISAGNPLLEAERTLLPNIRLFEMLQDYPDANILYLSSGGAVYGNKPSSKVIEDSSCQPLSYYAAGKVALEAFITALVQQSPRSAIILRPSNFYGPGQRFRAGFGLVPTIFECLHTGTPLKVWGDGSSVRDYLFIDDFIDLILKLLSSPAPSRGTHTYNVGAGCGYSLNQICVLIEELTKRLIPRQSYPWRPVDVDRIVLDVSRIKQDYGWVAETSLSDGLRATCKWWAETR